LRKIILRERAKSAQLLITKHRRQKISNPSCKSKITPRSFLSLQKMRSLQKSMEEMSARLNAAENRRPDWRSPGDSNEAAEMLQVQQTEAGGLQRSLDDCNDQAANLAASGVQLSQASVVRLEDLNTRFVTLLIF
jgi:hypothetical protein